MRFFTAMFITTTALLWFNADNAQVRQPADAQEVAMAQVDTAPDIDPSRGRRRR